MKDLLITILQIGIAGIICIIAIGALAGLLFLIPALFAWILMLLWNWISPIWWDGAPVLTFSQSVGTIILITLVTSLLKGIFSVGRSTDNK